jgi:hypothetical protein
VEAFQESEMVVVVCAGDARPVGIEGGVLFGVPELAGQEGEIACWFWSVQPEGPLTGPVGDVAKVAIRRN